MKKSIIAWVVALMAILGGLSGSARSQASSPTDLPKDAILAFQFTGATDIHERAATAVHCTNLGPRNTQLWLSIDNGFDDPWSDSVALAVGRSVTLTTQETLLYFEREIIPGSVRQGWGGIYVEDQTRIICSAQILDPLHAVPVYLARLPLFTPAGVRVGETTDRIYLPMLRR